MKKTITTLVLFLAVLLTSQAQEIKSTINPDALAQFQENPKEYLANWDNQNLIGYELTNSKKAVEAKLSLIFFSPKGQWQTVTSESFKLFPNTTLYPNNILLPESILQKISKGKGLILFDLQVNHFEHLSLLRKLPGRIPVVFNN